MITANEALQRAKDFHLLNIEKFISEAADSGQTQCNILPTTQFVSPENKQILIENGFEVNELQTFSGNEVTIKWDK